MGFSTISKIQINQTDMQ